MTHTTVKALSGTRETVSPLDVIKQIVPLCGIKRVLVAGTKSDGEEFSGEVLSVDMKSHIVLIFDDEQDLSLDFVNIASLEHTNSHPAFT